MRSSGVSAPGSIPRHSIIASALRPRRSPGGSRQRAWIPRVREIEGVERGDGDRLHEGGSVAHAPDIDAMETRLPRLHRRCRLRREDVALGAAYEEDGPSKSLE